MAKQQKTRGSEAGLLVVRSSGVSVMFVFTSFQRPFSSLLFLVHCSAKYVVLSRLVDIMKFLCDDPFTFILKQKQIERFEIGNNVYQMQENACIITSIICRSSLYVRTSAFHK
jgi:hypothetical protein